MSQLEERLKFLKDDKDVALKDYQSKIDVQEKQIGMAQRELDELKRINKNKDSDNSEALTKIRSDKDLLRNHDSEYKQLRDSNDDQVARNKHLKDEIAALQDQIQEESKRAMELKGLKDKLSHQLYRGAEDSEQLVDKELELTRRLRDKEAEQRVIEDKVRRVERELAEAEQKHSLQKTQKASEDTRVIQLRSQLNALEDENHRLQEQQKRQREQTHLENIKEEELHTRLREQQYKLAKREDEQEQLSSDLRIVSRDNDILKEKYENLIVERNALKEHSDRIIEANREIEKELDSFVNLDDSIVGTLERRDRHLSPIISQYKPPTTTQSLQATSLTGALRNHNPTAALRQTEQQQPAE